MSIAAAVITCSDSVALGRHRDESGTLAARVLEQLGLAVSGPQQVPDEVPLIAAAVSAAIDSGARIVVCNGGTGMGPRDVTVEAVETLQGVAMPGVGEAMRADARPRVPTTDLSRSGAYRVGRSLVLVLPGSPGGVRDGLRIAGPLLLHAVAMIDGGGHGPSAGGDGSPAGRALVTAGPIDLQALIAAAAHDGAGALVTFEGRVRNSDHGREVVSLTYEGHPDAEQVLAGIVDRSAQGARVLGAAAAHRVGDLHIGELAFAAVIAAAHRGPAFEALIRLVDEVKEQLPVWKRQVFADGSHEWVNCA